MYSSVRSVFCQEGKEDKATFSPFVLRDPSEWRKMRDPKYWETETEKGPTAAENNPYVGSTPNLEVEIEILRKQNEDLLRRVETLEKERCQETAGVTSDEHVDNDDPPVPAEEGQQQVASASSRSENYYEKDTPSTLATPPVPVQQVVDNESDDTVSLERDGVNEVGTKQGPSLAGGDERRPPRTRRINERRRARKQKEGSSDGNPRDMVFAFECDKCDKRFMQMLGLRIHQGSMHSASNPDSVKKYQCNVCGKAFRAPHHLRLHEVMHAPKGDFKCVHCNRSFGTSTSMKCHQRKARCARTNRRKSSKLQSQSSEELTAHS